MTDYSEDLPRHIKNYLIETTWPDTVVCEERKVINLFSETKETDTIWIGVHWPSGAMGFGPTRNAAEKMARARAKWTKDDWKTMI